MKLRLTTVLLLACLLCSCGPGGISDETSDGCYPRNLQVDVNSGTMDIYWQAECNRLISGYNIYINTNPLVKKYRGTELPREIKAFNPTPFSGDTNPDDTFEHFIAEGLENGVKYYVSVRVVNPDGTLSKPSNEVVTVCGPTGEIELSLRYRSNQDGYSFEQNEYVPADDLNNDLYFFSNEEGDFLNSPVKLNGFLRDNRLRRLSQRGEFRDVREGFSNISARPDQQKLAINVDDWVHLRTTDGANAFIRVLDFTGEGAERKVRLFFAYNSLKEQILF